MFRYMEETLKEARKLACKHPCMTLCVADALAIIDRNHRLPFDIVCDGFWLGFMQGYKAAKKDAIQNVARHE